jgi:hypothetical protein
MRYIVAGCRDVGVITLLKDLNEVGDSGWVIETYSVQAGSMQEPRKVTLVRSNVAPGADVNIGELSPCSRPAPSTVPHAILAMWKVINPKNIVHSLE